MARNSSIARLPEQFRLKITSLRDQGRTIDEIMEALDKLDVEVSRSALGRHLKKMDQIAERMRKSRQLAEAVGREFGDAEASQVQRTNVELLHSILMQVMVGDDDKEMVTLDPKDAMFLATAIEKLSKASKTDLETQIKAAEERARRATLEAAANTAEKAARKNGLSSDVVEDIKKQILGIE